MKCNYKKSKLSRKEERELMSMIGQKLFSLVAEAGAKKAAEEKWREKPEDE